MNTLTSLLQQKSAHWAAQEKENSQSLPGAIFRHMATQKELRLPQREAIQVYLWLKFVGNNPRLADVVRAGLLTDEDRLREHELDTFADGQPGVQFLALFAAENDAKNLQTQLLKDSQGKNHDWDKVLDQVLNSFAYPNYIYSLPMGAGKTYLMAAFIYLDLYFARLFPGDKRFARNFVVFAPHAAKTAILPSLQTIKNFDPGWVIPGEEAARLRQTVLIEILDALASDRRDKLHGANPNLEKVKRIRQTRDFGMVFITNAEKVVLERLDATAKKQLKGQKALEDMEEVKGFNLLREELSQIPQLGVLLDEVHHAGSDVKKLRAAIDVLNQHSHVTYAAGLTGTPYVSQDVQVGDKKIKLGQMQDVVYFYPLATGIGQFLKRPKVYQDNVAESSFVHEALSRFFAEYDRVYPSGAKSKIAFYCPSIEALNENILPAVQEWYAQHRSGKDGEIFRYYSGVSKAQKEKGWELPKNATAQFHALDRAHSPYRVVLLVAVGTEGWDCKSLTGVALPRNATTKNFVLQTTCRCLREVQNAHDERALIYLNPANYETLDKELKAAYQTSIKDLEKDSAVPQVKVIVRKPERSTPLQYKQVHRKYKLVTRTGPPPAERLKAFDWAKFKRERTYDPAHVQVAEAMGNGLQRQSNEQRLSATDFAAPPSFSGFLCELALASFGTLGEAQLRREHGATLEAIFQNVRADWPWIARHPDAQTWPELLNHLIGLLQETSVYESESFTENCEVMLLRWNGEAHLPLMSSSGKMNLFLPEIQREEALMVARYASVEIPERVAQLDTNDVSFNYAPYPMDSKLEQNALCDLLKLSEMQGCEVYFNGFKHEKLDSFWIQTPQGRYTPDFLILRRDAAGQIARVLIIETKGKTYDADFAPKKKFMEEVFVPHNPHMQFVYCLDEDGKNNFATQLDDVKKGLAWLAG